MDPGNVIDYDLQVEPLVIQTVSKSKSLDTIDLTLWNADDDTYFANFIYKSNSKSINFAPLQSYYLMLV